VEEEEEEEKEEELRQGLKMQQRKEHSAAQHSTPPTDSTSAINPSKPKHNVTVHGLVESLGVKITRTLACCLLRSRTLTDGAWQGKCKNTEHGTWH